MRNESQRVFVDQHESPKLIRLTRFAAAIELRMRFKDTEELVVVGNGFAFQNAAAGCAADLLGSLDKYPYFSDAADGPHVQFVFAMKRFAHLRSPREDLLCPAKQLAILLLQSLFVVAAFARAEAGNLTRSLFHFLQQVLVLSPADGVIRFAKLHAQFDDLACSINDQRTLGRVVDIGFDDKRIGPLFLRGCGFKAVGLLDDAVANRFEGLRFQSTNVVTDTAGLKIVVAALPVANSHDLPQGPMLLGKVLQFVVVQIAAKSNGCQHGDFPVAKPFASAVVSRILIDILFDKIENPVAERRLAVDMLQTCQDRHNFVAAIQVQGDV